MYTATVRRDIITADTTFNDNIYSGWLAVNTGATVATVFGVKLQPNAQLDFTQLQPNVKWTQPIQVLPNSGEVTLLRLIYKEV